MTRTRLIGMLVVFVLLLAACGGDDAADTSDAAGSAAAALTVATADVGDVLVDGEGYSLYIFMPDEQNAGVSTCEDACLANWPALEAVEAGDGVDASLIGTIERSDGSTQATYNGWPLYYFANDSAAGDTNGQGVNDVWYLIAPDGSPMS